MDTLRHFVATSSATDRGHMHSDGRSVIQIWVSTSSFSNLNSGVPVSSPRCTSLLPAHAGGQKMREEVAAPFASDDSRIEDIVGEHEDKDDLSGTVDTAIADTKDLDDALRKVFVEYLKSYRGQLPDFFKAKGIDFSDPKTCELLSDPRSRSALEGSLKTKCSRLRSLMKFFARTQAWNVSTFCWRSVWSTMSPTC